MENGSAKGIVFVLFGAGGDLSNRLVMPALFNLHLDGQLPEPFVLLGVGHRQSDPDALVEGYRQSIERYSRREIPNEETWQRFCAKIRYMQADLDDENAYPRLADQLATITSQGPAAQYVFYMATPPSLFIPIADGLGKAGLAREKQRTRIVVEKPLGHDLESSRRINAELCRYFTEKQIFRIDHFLGKETVQNIMALRFANPIFEPLWNRRYIDHVAITVAETLGVEKRGHYYENAGALRDMVQNHLLQLLCLVAMEPPVAYEADDIRDKKLEVLRAVRPITKATVMESAARGQYDAGWIQGQQVKAYRAEPDVARESNTETFAALKLYIDNWRWQDVPFYLRTGKRMTTDVSEISIRFGDVPHRAFPKGIDTQPVRLIIQIQPEQGIVLKFMAKEPGYTLRLHPVSMRFCYQEAFKKGTPEAYETLLWDVMQADPTLFMHADQVEAAWRIVMPVLEAWAENPPPDFPNYPAGSWGPESAETLVAKDGRNWLTPTTRPECSIED